MPENERSNFPLSVKGVAMIRWGFALLMVCGMLAGRAGAQDTPDKNDAKKVARYETRKIHDPHGTGKFYMGREIARVMSYEGAGWLERPEREKEEHVSKLLPALKIKPGEVIVDLGAGSGFYTVKLAEAVGEKGLVYALDVQKEMIEILDKRLTKEKIKNVKTVLNTATEMKLKDNSVDMIFMVDVYHELSHPYEMTVNMMKALKVGGRLVFVEYRLEDENVPILTVHRMSEKQVKAEMALHALKHMKTHDHLPWQHVIVFEKVEKKKAEEKKSTDNK